MYNSNPITVEERMKAFMQTKAKQYPELDLLNLESATHDQPLNRVAAAFKRVFHFKPLLPKQQA